MFINMDVYVKRLTDSQIKEIIYEISGPDAEITYIKRVSTGPEIEVSYDGDEEYYVLHDYYYEGSVNNGTNSSKNYRKKMLEIIGMEYAERYLLH